MSGFNNLGYCGVDCSACPDDTQGECPSCRDSRWADGDICLPVRCCREKGLDLCGQCGVFPCPMMAESYQESDSHRQAEERMLRFSQKSR